MRTTTKLTTVTALAAGVILATIAPAAAAGCTTDRGVGTDALECDAQVEVTSDGDGTISTTVTTDIDAQAEPVDGVSVSVNASPGASREISTPTVSTPSLSTPSIDDREIGAGVGGTRVSATVGLDPIHVRSLTVSVPATGVELYPLRSGERHFYDDEFRDATVSAPAHDDTRAASTPPHAPATSVQASGHAGNRATAASASATPASRVGQQPDASADARTQTGHLAGATFGFEAAAQPGGGSELGWYVLAALLVAASAVAVSRQRSPELASRGS